MKNLLSDWNQFSFSGLMVDKFFPLHISKSETQLFTLRCQKPSGVAKLTQRKCDEWILQNSYTIENCELHLKNACSFFWGGHVSPHCTISTEVFPKKSSEVFLKHKRLARYIGKGSNWCTKCLPGVVAKASNNKSSGRNVFFLRKSDEEEGWWGR